MRRLANLGRVLVARILGAIPIVLGIVVLNFFLLQLAPGDAADYIAAESGDASVETMATLRRHFGLDLPVLEQLYAYLYGLAHFNLGISPRFNVPVADLILQRMPNTLLLMFSSLALAMSAGIALGVLMSAYAGSAIDRGLSTLVLIIDSAPGYWLGLILIIVFSVPFGVLPTGGAGTIGADLTGFARLLDTLRYLTLPALSLAALYVAIYSRVTRAAMLEVWSQDYIRTARAKGLGALRIAVRHVLRNALLPITTIGGLHVGGMLGGAVVIETVFNWPGLGRLAVESVMARDFKILLGILLLSSLLVILINMAIDLLQAALDPRIGGRA